MIAFSLVFVSGSLFVEDRIVSSCCSTEGSFYVYSIISIIKNIYEYQKLKYSRLLFDFHRILEISCTLDRIRRILHIDR